MKTRADYPNIEEQIDGIKRRLILARQRAGLSQTQAARLVGFKAASSLSPYEIYDNTVPDLRLFLKLCVVYGVSPVWALTGVNPDFDASEILLAAGTVNEDTARLIEMLSSLERIT
jgi:transcriptional regulator with XRE-family HTH domain